MDNRIPVVVRMQVECARCGHIGDDRYEFDMPFAKSQPMEAHEPGECPKCGAPVNMRLKRTQQKQQLCLAARRQSRSGPGQNGDDRNDWHNQSEV
jgi:hypothetical protein